MTLMDKEKIRSADIEPRAGYHYLLIDGVEAGRFESIQKALAAREVCLQHKWSRWFRTVLAEVVRT